VESICYKLFALNQPVAMDLRTVMSALKINSNLERIGDLAVNIAGNSIEIKNKPEFFSRVRFSETAAIAREMIKNSIDSFIEKNADLAKKVLATDDKLDELVKENRKILIDIMKEKADYVENGMRYHSIFQALERLGDHATNIAEEVYFIVKAESIKHRSEEPSPDDDVVGY
jgi:phosphate transport system protein